MANDYFFQVKVQHDFNHNIILMIYDQDYILYYYGFYIFPLGNYNSPFGNTFAFY